MASFLVSNGMGMNLLFKKLKCNHHWETTLIIDGYSDFDGLIHDVCYHKYNIYCPKCGKRKRNLSEKKYKTMMNEQNIRENYNI